MEHSCDRFKPFERPITFSCVVNGRLIAATILGKDDLEVSPGYRIVFSDGFRAMFVITESGWQAEKKGGEPYVEAVKMRLDNFLRNSGKTAA